MNLKDKILKFQAYALTNSTSVYNEDSMTAQQLAISSANKIKECLLMIDDLATAISNIADFLKLNYDETDEELTISIEKQIEELKNQVDSSYVSIFNEDAMTTLELAGCTARATNECLKAVNMLSDLVLDVNKLVSLSYVSDTETLVVGGEE